MAKKVIIIGAGFSGLSSACFMAKAGWEVKVIEKHHLPGGRARKMEVDGFTFDMGPSWYWMPDVFERFFNQFNKKVADYYTLERLNPSYTVFWNDEKMDVPANLDELKNLFETYESNAGNQLAAFLEEAAYKYNVGIKKLVFKPGKSITEFLDWEVIKGVVRLDVFANMKAHIAKYFKHPKLQQLLEFPVLFLGALPQDMPALYSLMNYADIVGGTWYPKGGMYKIVEAMHSVAIENGVEFCFEEEVKELKIENENIQEVITTNTNGETIIHKADVVIGSADYHYIETKLLPQAYRNYSNEYWDKRVMAPSCLIYYVGLNKKLTNLNHHSLFFDTSFEVHGNEIYKSKTWPVDPLFYVSATSVSDDSVAPTNHENLFFLIPIAAGLQGDNKIMRDKYFNQILARFEKQINQTVVDNIVFKKSYSVSNFISDYGAFKGNAYGLANTLFQTSILKPSCQSKKVKNLFYTGQLTVPGPGVPPCLISGEVVANEVINIF